MILRTAHSSRQPGELGLAGVGGEVLEGPVGGPFTEQHQPEPEDHADDREVDEHRTEVEGAVYGSNDERTPDAGDATDAVDDPVADTAEMGRKDLRGVGVHGGQQRVDQHRDGEPHDQHDRSTSGGGECEQQYRQGNRQREHIVLPVPPVDEQRGGHRACHRGDSQDGDEGERLRLGVSPRGQQRRQPRRPSVGDEDEARHRRRGHHRALDVAPGEQVTDRSGADRRLGTGRGKGCPGRRLCLRFQPLYQGLSQIGAAAGDLPAGRLGEASVPGRDTEDPERPEHIHPPPGVVPERNDDPRDQCRDRNGDRPDCRDDRKVATPNSRRQQFAGINHDGTDQGLQPHSGQPPQYNNRLVGGSEGGRQTTERVHDGGDEDDPAPPETVRELTADEGSDEHPDEWRRGTERDLVDTQPPLRAHRRDRVPEHDDVHGVEQVEEPDEDHHVPEGSRRDRKSIYPGTEPGRVR